MNDADPERAGPSPAGPGEAVVAGIAVAAVVMALIGFPTGCEYDRGTFFLLANAFTVFALVVGVVTFQHKGRAQVVLWAATGVSALLLFLGWVNLGGGCSS